MVLNQVVGVVHGSVQGWNAGDHRFDIIHNSCLSMFYLAFVFLFSVYFLLLELIFY